MNTSAGITFVLLSGLSVFVNCNVLNRYTPSVTSNLFKQHRIYVGPPSGKKVECSASFGMSRGEKETAKRAIATYYSGIEPSSGLESNQISMEMERKYGGYWMVAIFSSDFDMAYTITRRSLMYGVFDIDDKVILIAKDGYSKPNNGPFL